MPRELFQRFVTTRSIPHIELASLPTPVQRLAACGAQLGIENLWVKRDDQTGTLYGGNKVRKLEFLLADARAGGKNEVWTVGAIGSHHALATCIYARELGMECGVLHFPQPLTPHVQDNICALSTTRPKVHLLARGEESLPGDVFKQRLSEWRDAHPDVYYIPGGGSSPVGVLGYVNAALELVAAVEDGTMPKPDRIYVAAGTCGTLAGLLLGFALARMDLEVVGVRVVATFIANDHVVASLANRAGDILRAAGVDDVPFIAARDVRIDDSQFGVDYGIPTEAGLEARDLVGRTEGLKLEPTYTAKAFAALVADRAELAGADRTVLYWHTLNGADLSERIAAADLDALPPEYRDWATAIPRYERH